LYKRDNKSCTDGKKQKKNDFLSVKMVFECRFVFFFDKKSSEWRFPGAKNTTVVLLAEEAI